MPNINWTFVSWVANIILPLFLVFQWLWDRAREKTVKNNLFATRRMVSRGSDPEAILDSLDATLATIGARKSFKAWGKAVMTFIRNRGRKEEEAPLSTLIPKKGKGIPSPMHLSSEE